MTCLLLAGNAVTNCSLVLLAVLQPVATYNQNQGICRHFLLHLQLHFSVTTFFFVTSTQKLFWRWETAAAGWKYKTKKYLYFNKFTVEWKTIFTSDRH